MSSLANIAHIMVETGLHQWGFVIYRCVYGDDDLWDRYLGYMKAVAGRCLDEERKRGLMEQYLKWTVMDNR